MISGSWSTTILSTTSSIEAKDNISIYFATSSYYDKVTSYISLGKKHLENDIKSTYKKIGYTTNQLYDGKVVCDYINNILILYDASDYISLYYIYNGLSLVKDDSLYNKSINYFNLYTLTFKLIILLIDFDFDQDGKTDTSYQEYTYRDIIIQI